MGAKVAGGWVAGGGTPAPRSGTYQQIAPHGALTGTRVSVERGAILPPTLDARHQWVMVGVPAEREPPAMQVVTKGWWTLREERMPVATLEAEDRDGQRRG